MKPEIEYLSDERVDDALDLEIRGLLTTCFTKPQDVVFKDRRYFREPYPHRSAALHRAQREFLQRTGFLRRSGDLGGFHADVLR